MSTRIPTSLDELPTTARRFVGKEVRRVEDRALVTGRAEFIDNLVLPDMLHCAIQRSPHPHARIVRIDTSRAEAHPGVAAVLRRTSTPASATSFRSQLSNRSLGS